MDCQSDLKLLTGAIRSGALSATELRHAVSLLAELDGLDGTSSRRQVDATTHVIDRVRDLVADSGSVRRPGTTDEGTGAFTRLCRSLGVRRALVSTVDGGTWCPGFLYVAPDLEPSHDSLRSYLKTTRIPLREARFEAEALRRWAPAVVRAPRSDPRTYKPLMDLSDSHGFAVAPLRSMNRVRGLVHIDHFDEEVRWKDVEALELMREVMGIVLDEAHQRRRLEALSRKAADLARRVGQLQGGGTVADNDPPRAARDEPEGMLTRRERQVLELIREGLTNPAIADRLGLGEATIKSHVSSVLAKLEVSSRSAAVACALTKGLLDGVPR